MNKKQLSIALSALLVLGGCSSNASKDSTSSQAASSVEKQSLTLIELHPFWETALVNEETDIDFKTEPAAIILEAPDFQTSGGSVVLTNNKPIFKAEEPGDYIIFAQRDGVKSNEITIHVIALDDPQADSIRAEHEAKKQEAEASSQASSSEDASADSASDASVNSDSSVSGAVSVSEVLENPSAYVGQDITVTGSLPANSEVDANGQSVVRLYSDSLGTGEGLVLSGNTNFPFSGTTASITGTLKQNANGEYVFDVDRGEKTMSSIGSGSVSTWQPAPSVSVSNGSVASMPATGKFQFTADDIIIRYGMEGLDGAPSGYVFNDGMSVYYDGIYVKDGYTWITYISYAGDRYSAAIGNETDVLYGFLAS